MVKREHYVVGIDEAYFNTLKREAKHNSALEGIVRTLEDRSRNAINDVRVLSDGFVPRPTSLTDGSLEHARWVQGYLAHQYKLPVDRLHLYKETVTMELVED